MNADEALICLSCGQRMPSYLGGVSIDTSQTEGKTPMVIAGNIDFPLPPSKTPTSSQPPSSQPPKPSLSPKSEKPVSSRFPKPPLFPRIESEAAAIPKEEKRSQTDAFDEEDFSLTKPPKRSLPPPDPLSMSRPSHMIYAGFWYRFLAWLIDIVILGVVQGTLGMIVLMVSAVFAFRGGDFSAASFAFFFGAYGVVVLASIVVSLLYFALSESSRWQGTLGKLAMGLKVTDADGHRLSFPHALMRYVSHIASNLTLGIGYVLNVFTPRQQALHDLIASTLVVYKEVTPTDLAYNPAVPARTAQKMSVLLVWVMSMMFLGLVALVSRTLSEMPAYQTDSVAVRMHEAEMLGAEATAAVSGYREIHRRFPPTLDAANFHQTSPQVRQLWIDADSGIIHLELAFPPLRKKTLMFAPELDEEDDLIWICRSDDIDPKHLPDHCR
jgi:uncharacterized RDD family membrane protein YckC